MGSVDAPAMMTTWMPTKQAWSDLSFTSSKTENNIDYRFITPNRSAKPVPRAQKQTINSKVVHCPLLRETVNQRTSIKFNLNSIQNRCPEANYKFKKVVQCPLLRETVNQSITFTAFKNVKIQI